MTAQTLTDAAPALLAISDDDILAAWNDTLAAFLDAGSPERRALDPDLLAATGLSPEGLQRGLESIGTGMLGEPAAAELRRSLRQHEDGFSLVVLPANPPGLILQSLWPALAARAPVLFKSSRAEPFFAPAFLAALGRLQGIAVAGHMPTTVRRAFGQAGVSRFAPAGELQATDAAWRNGGIDLAAEFAVDY